MLYLHIFAFIIFQGLTNYVFRLADCQFACTLYGELAVSWSFKEKVISSMHSELKVKVSVLVGFLFNFSHVLQHF
jgi:hypothetical protein